jgi:tape measure domain-containing protein
MSGSANRWVLRLSTEGADQVIRDLRAAATESAAAGRAYDALIKAQPALATGAERAEQALRKNVDAMRGMRGELSLVSAAAEGAAGSLGRFGSALTSPAAAVAAMGAAASAGVVQIARFGDQYTETMNKLRAATGSVQAAGGVYAELVAMSQQTGASISESAGAFVRFSVAARAIGATNGEVLQLTRTIQQAGLISGASTQEAAAGVQQLGQALASGQLQGDELRSILENMPTLAEALARELGVSVGQLRSMGSEGQLTSDRVFQALLRAGEQINKQFTELTPTMGRAFGMLGQAMVEFVGKLDQALGLSQAIARAAQAAAGAVSNVSRGIGPRSPAEQAEFDVSEAQRRQAELVAEMERLRTGAAPTSRRGSISRGLQETAASAQDRETRLAELQAAYEAENRVIAAALDRRNQAHQQTDDVRQAEEATAYARRQEAARAAQTTAFNETRDALDRERKLRTDHADRIKAIDAGLANGTTNAIEAARLRRLANEELADGLKALEQAARGRLTTDEDLAAVGQAVADMERDRQSLMRDGEAVTASVRTEAEKYAETLANLNNLLAAGAISQETYNRAVAAADPAVKAAQEASRRIEQENTRTTDRITSFFGDAFARAFEGTGNGFRGLMESFRRAAISTFASIAAQAIIRPIVAPIVQGLGLGQLGSGNLSGLFAGGTAQAATTAGGGAGIGAADLGSFSTLRTAYNGLTSPGGLGGFFPGGNAIGTGWGGLDSVLNTQIFGSGATNNALAYMGQGVYGPATPSAVAASGGGATLGQLIGPGLAVAGGAYGVYSGLQRGGIGGYTSAAGGAVSAVTGLAMLGSAAGLLPALGALGPIGLGIGAVLAIAGALAPGAKPSGQGQLARINLNSGAESFEGLGGKRFSQANRDNSSSAVEGIANLAREIGDRLGGARIGGDIAVGTTNSLLYLDVNGQKGQFANDADGAKQLSEAAARMVLNEFRGQGVLAGPYAGIAAASGDSLERLSQNLEFFEGAYKALSKTADQTSAFTKQLEAIAQPYDAAIAKARELGLAEEALAANRAEAVAKAQAARDAQVDTLRDTLAGRAAAAGLGGGNVVQLSDTIAARQAARAASEELEQLRQRMIDLGLSSEEVAASVQQLSEIQGAEASKQAADLAYTRNLTAAQIALGIEARAAAAFGNEEAAASIAARQAALSAADELRKLEAQLLGIGVSSEEAARWVATLSEVQAEEARKRLEEAERARAGASAADASSRRAQTAAEREQGASSALGVITSLRSYAASLSTTNAGAGTALDRLAASQRQFDAVFGAAAAGDASSISGLQGAAESYRQAAREVYGGGQGFADALRLIEQRISSISNLGADALTQSFFAENARANTDRIVDALAALRRENALLRADLNMLMARPAA